MNTPALVMLILSVGVLWGGLILATLHLVRNPDEPED
jgi:hypothetical protein